MGRVDDVKKILDDSLQNEEKVPVYAITRIFMEVTQRMIEADGTALNYIKEEMGNSFLRKLMGELSGSIIGSIHMSSKFRNNLEGAMKYAKETNCTKVFTDDEEDEGQVGGQA